MKNVKNHKLPLKILSTLIAIILWFAITYTEDPAVNQLISNLDTTFMGDDLLSTRGLVVVNTKNLPALSATIRGNRSNVISSLGAVYASIDVSGITQPGTHNVPVQYNYPKEYVQLTKTKASSVSVDVEKILSRQVPVKIESIVNERNDQKLYKLQSLESHVTILGAQSTVTEIAYAGVTVDTSEISVDGTMNYSYKLYDGEDKLIDESNITSKSHPTIPVNAVVFDKTELPVEVVLSDKLKKNYILNIKKQSVTKLNAGIKEPIEQNVLYATFDEEHLDSNGNVTLKIDTPEHLYIPDDALNISVEYELLPKIQKEVELSIQAKNVPEGKTVTTVPSKVRITVMAPADAAFNKISASFDASKLTTEQEKNVALDITVPENIEIIGTYSVSAKLN